MARRKIRGALLDGGLFLAACGAVRAMATPKATALAFGLRPELWMNRVFDFSMVLALALFVLLAYRFATHLYRIGRRAGNRASLAGCESGAVMVEWVLVLPIFLMIVGMVVQLALLCNGAMVVRYAAFAAARSAIVSLERSLLTEEVSLEYPTGLSADDRIKRVAAMVLASISPKASASLLEAPAIIHNTLQNQASNGWEYGDSKMRERFPYAEAATTVTIDEGFPDIKLPTGLDSFLGSGLASPTIPVPNLASPFEVKVTLRYRFLITIPVFNIPAKLFQVHRDANPMSPTVKGETFDIEQACVLQSTGARQGSLAFQAAALLQDASVLP